MDYDVNIGGYRELVEFTKPEYDYRKLKEITKQVARNLNTLIDHNYYPVPETMTSNRRHRPIGIGVQGLADVLARLRIPFDSEEGIDITAKISEYMYLGACQVSMDMARKRKKHVQEYRRIIKKMANMESQNQTEDYNQLAKEADMLKKQYFIYDDEIEKLPMGLAGAYSTFVGSPASEGKLQYDLWNLEKEKMAPELVKIGERRRY